MAKTDQTFVGFNLRLPPELHKRIGERALIERRSLHAQILTMLEMALSDYKVIDSDFEAEDHRREK